MKRCPYCSAQIADDSLFCEVCGKKQPQGKVCSQCGMPINDGDVFRRNCGQKIEEEVLETAPAAEAEIGAVSEIKASVYNESPSSKVVIGIVALCAVLIGGVLLYKSHSVQKNLSEDEAVEQTASIGNYSDGSHNDNFTDNSASQDYGWLEGHWVCDSPTGRIHLLIQNGHICQYRNSPSESDNLPYDIRDGRINAHYDDGLDITYDIDEENKRIGMGSGYYAQKVGGSASATASSAYDTDSSTRFQSADDVYGYLANQRFRERSQGIELRYDGSCQLYINGEWNAPPFHVVSLQSKQAIINYNSPSDGSMRLIVRIVGRDIEVQDPIDGTVFYQVKSRF